MNKRERFLGALHCQPVDRPPLWLMRQAGRALPEYRALRQRYSFLQLVQNKELATEVTLQPLRRFGFDAAILFSDILVVPEALGQPYQFRDTGGVQMDFAIQGESDLNRLRWDGFLGRLEYVANALRMIKKELNGQHALLGFCGSPWTLANFMVEGGSSKEFVGAADLLKREPAVMARFLERLAQATVEYLRLQVQAGADGVQIFDSLGGLLDDHLFYEGSARWIVQIVRELSPLAPVIVFSKGPRNRWEELLASGARVLGFDSTTPLAKARQLVPAQMAIQGNLDPAVMTTTTAEVAAATKEVLDQINGRRGYIFNLGHGLPATTPLENIQTLVETVTTYPWQN